MFRRRVLLVAAAAAIVSGCATMSSPVSVADTIAANPSLSTLNGLIVKAGLTPTLKGAGPFTVFAPTNDAFKAVPAKTMDDLAKNPAMLKDVLTYHVIAAKVMSADVKNGPVKTVNGANVAVAKAGDFVTVEDSMVQTANIVATNGVVHTVDRVMIPPKKN
ncbi:MAG: fasciclin domain-containing protein [Polaromonas sp.]|nr:fasciclin domain-containing protein [Polaromonas sp.]MDP3750538.1 fasciclin domain-containing protein [Polaromonas sp.]